MTLNDSYYESLLELVDSIDSVRLLRLAQKHLPAGEFTEIVAGLA